MMMIVNERSIKKCMEIYLKNNYSEDTVATIINLLAKTNTPQKTLNEILEVLHDNLNNYKPTKC